MGRMADCKGQTALIPVLLVLLLSQSGCYLPYIIKQWGYQLKLSNGSIPVEDALEAQNISPNNKSKLLIVNALKRYSVKTLGMSLSDNYTIINPTWNTKLHSVSGSKELSFEPYLWSFPFLGKVPYLGFFDEADALAEEGMLKHLGYETMIGQVGGYSTLGFFNDPIWPQMLQRSIHSLSDLVLHELAHSNLYFSGQSSFNESFANFVGKLGALQFLHRNYGPHSTELYEAIQINEDEDLYNNWVEAVYQDLESIYKKTITAEEKRKEKLEATKRAKVNFAQIHFHSSSYQKIKVPEINNAFILMSRRYNSGQKDFERLFLHLKGDWKAFFSQLKSLKSSPDPFNALKKMVASYDLDET